MESRGMPSASGGSRKMVRTYRCRSRQRASRRPTIVIRPSLNLGPLPAVPLPETTETTGPGARRSGSTWGGAPLPRRGAAAQAPRLPLPTGGEVPSRRASADRRELRDSTAGLLGGGAAEDERAVLPPSGRGAGRRLGQGPAPPVPPRPHQDTDPEGQDATGGVEPVVVGGDDDGEEGEDGVAEDHGPQPRPPGRREEDQRAPERPGEVEARHGGVLVGHLLHGPAVERPQPAVGAQRVDEAV